MADDLGQELLGLIQQLEEIPAAYGDQEPLPGPTDEKIGRMVARYRELTRARRIRWTTMLESRAARARLNMFARRMAMLAVRRQSPELLRDGLIAQMMTGFRLDQYYDLLMILSLLSRSARRLKLGEEFLRETLQYADGPVVGGHIQDFFHRSEVDQAIEAMGYHEYQTAAGIVYWHGDEASIPAAWK